MIKSHATCRSKLKSFSSNKKHDDVPSVEPEELMLSTEVIEQRDSWELSERERDIRQGLDLATTLERIEKNFVISDPRLPDNPIVCSFLKTIEYVAYIDFSYSTLKCATKFSMYMCLAYNHEMIMQRVLFADLCIRQFP